MVVRASVYKYVVLVVRLLQLQHAVHALEGNTAHPRQLSSTIFPNTCNSSLAPDFHFRLDFAYLYRVNFKKGNELDLPGIEKAIAKRLGSVLNICDSEKRPLVAITYSGNGHQVSANSKSSPRV